MESSDSEYETEETVVLVELNGIIDTDLLLQQQSLTKILGIDTDEPLLQIGNCLFKGEYEDTLGTVVVYQPLDGSQKDGSESNESGFKFLCKTDTKLTMKRCFPQERSMDNLKSAEVAPPVPIPNDKPTKSVTASKMLSATKKKIVSKKKLKKPKAKIFVKSKKNIEIDQMNSVKKHNKKTLKSKQIENVAESKEDNSLSKSDSISSKVLNLKEKGDQSKPNYSEESIMLEDDKIEKEPPKKGRKRNHHEANDDITNPQENIEEFTEKKLMRVEKAEARVADEETINIDKENIELDNSDSKKNDVIFSGSEAFVPETDRSNEKMVDEECVIEALVSTVISNECEMQKKGTTELVLETNKEKIITEENKETNDASETSSVSDIDEKKKPLIEECAATESGTTVIDNENEIHEESTLANVSEINKVAVIEEIIVEEVDNTVGTNECEIQEKSIVSNTSEMDQVEQVDIDRKKRLFTEESTPTVSGTIVINNESEIQEKNTPGHVSEVNKVAVIEEIIVDEVDNTVGAKETEIQEKSIVYTVGAKETEIQEKSIVSNTSEMDRIEQVDMDAKKKLLTEECTPTVSGTKVINYESEIQERNTLGNVSEMNKVSVTEEIIVEEVDNTDGANETEIQEKFIVSNTSEMDQVEQVDIDRKKKLFTEECTPTVSGATVMDNESEIQEKNTLDHVSEKNKVAVIEEIIVEDVDNTVGANESKIQEISMVSNTSEMDQIEQVDMDAKKKLLTEECTPTVSGTKVIDYESEIQERNTLVNVSEMNKVSVTEEIIVEEVDNTVGANETEIQEKFIVSNTSEMDQVEQVDMDTKKKLLNEECTPTVSGTTVIDNESEIQERNTPGHVSEMNKVAVIEEIIVEEVDNTVGENESEIQEKFIVPNTSEMDQVEQVDMDTKKKLLTEECTSTVPGTIVIKNESEIQEKNTLGHISEMNKVAVIEEIIVEEVDNTVEANETEIQEKSIVSNTSEMDQLEQVHTDRKKKLFIEECTPTVSGATVMDNESEIQEKNTLGHVSEKNKVAVIEEIIVEEVDNTVGANENEIQEKCIVSNTSEMGQVEQVDMDRKKKLLTEECTPTVSGTIVIDNESEIQAKNTLGNVSEMNKVAVIKERIENSTVGANESEIQDKCTVSNISEMDQVEPMIEDGISKTVENIVINIESEIQPKSVPASFSEVDVNEEIVVEEVNAVKELDNTNKDVENLIQEKNTHLNIPDDAIGLSAGQTHEKHVVLEHVEVKDNDNCSSANNMEPTRNEGISELADVCESSDDAVNLHADTDISEKIDNDASSLSQENNESMLLEKIVVEGSNVNETESNIASHNQEELNIKEKDAICVASQFANVDDLAARKLDGFEDYNTSTDSAYKLVLNTVDNLNPVSAPDDSSPLIIGENLASSSRKHSSCEVTQSTISEGEYLENKDLVTEHEVLSETQQHDNVEKNFILEKDDQFQTTEVECSEPPPLKSNSTASEISISCQESKYSEGNLIVKFDADGAVCSQSINQQVVSPEHLTEGRDFCVSSCDIDDKAEYKGNTEEEVHFSSGGSADLSNCEGSENNVICEVSHSNESDKNSPALSDSSENEVKMLSNEYDESFSNTEENFKNAVTNQHIEDITGSIQEALNVPSTSSIHETAQSCSIKNTKLPDFPSDKNISNECNKNEASHAATELYDDKLKYDCVSSVGIPAVSETLLEIEADSEEKDQNSEVSQSFKPAENQQFGENCEASCAKAMQESGIVETAIEFKHPSEVSQSVQLESSTSHQNINECDKTEPSSDSLKSFSSYSVEYQGEICESSDDASNFGSNSQVEVQPVNYSICEVSQSFRSEETVSTRHSTDSEMENSNECEVHATYVEPQAETSKLNTSEKNICESSDDVNEFESEVAIDQVSERDGYICESSDNINETESEVIIDQIVDGEKNICESSDDIYEIESEIIVDQIIDRGKNICESSDDINETEAEIIIDQISDAGKNICESSDDINETEAEIIDLTCDTGKNICESSDDVNETDCEIIIDQIRDTGENICESSDDINETEAEIITDQISDARKNICESSDDINETEAEIIDLTSDTGKNICESSDDINETEAEIIDLTSDTGKNICESSDDINETEAEIINDQISDAEKNICESSDDINETEAEIIIDQISDSGKNCCESSDDINETEAEMVIDQLNKTEKNICESSDDIGENFGNTHGHTPIHLEVNISDEACQSSKFDENVLSASETEVLTQAEENFTKCETSLGRSNIEHATICESSEDTIRIESNDQKPISDACTSSDKSVMVSSDVAANLYDIKSSVSDVTVGEIENNQISQSSNAACGCMDMSVNGTENSMISQSGNSENIPVYETLNESENSQISQSGGYLEEASVTEIESEISQSGGVTGGSNVVTLNETENNQISQSGSQSEGVTGVSAVVKLNETENNQISQSGCGINASRNAAVEETENDQISQSESTVGRLNDIFVTEAENNQISQSGNNESVSTDKALNEVENSQISQSGAIASYSADISIAETENSLISQSGSMPVYLSDISMPEAENNQISQSVNAKEFLYHISVNESDNNQISQSSSSSNLPNNVISREMENNQISQSGTNSTDTVSETENNQISQSSSGGCILIKESENYQISQSSSSCGPPNILSPNETENNQISQSQCNDNIYELSQTLPSDSPSQTEVVNISSSSDIVSSNYIDVTNSSFYVSNSTISSNSEVSPSITRVRPHIWDRNSLVTSVTTSEMRTSVLPSEQTNEIESRSAETSAPLEVSSCSFIVGENRENVTSMDQEMSSSNNINEVVESSLSLIREEEEVNKFTPTDDSPMSVSESVVEEMPSTSQNLDRIGERMQNIETSSSKAKSSEENFQSSVSGNSLLQKQFEFDPNLLQTSFLPCVSSQSDIGNNSSSTRPSFLEVMASSASDFRNSLLSDNNFGKDKSHTSSAPESSGSNISSCGEFSESFIREADGLVRNRSSDNASHAPENLSDDNSIPADSEVSRSSGIKRKYSDSGEFGSSHQVSQSSDVVNTLSSTSRTHPLISDNISQSSQQDFVQSSSNILRTSSVLVSNDSVSVIDQVSSAVENTSFVNKDSGNADISESSVGVESALPSCSQNTFSLTNSNQLIESSSDQPTFTVDASDFKQENTESEVSSTPSETIYAGFRVLTEGKNQFSAIQGNVIILPETSNVIDESDVDITTVEISSPENDYVPIRSDLNSESILILDSSNEAETLNRSSVPSPIAIQLASFDQAALSVDVVSQARIVSGSPIGEVEVVNYEESSEVSESLMNSQNDISQSSLGDNNVSCSVSAFSSSERAIHTNYSFPDISQEAESKSSDDCISSYHSTCDNILPVPNLQSSADREFYSHVGEFDDSVQSSLDETHMAINEQIKAISSPPNSSDSASCEEPRSLSLNPFVTFSSQSHVFSTNYGATSSRMTLCSSSASEIGLERDSLIEDSPQVITTTSNSDIIISSFDPELANMSQSPQNSGNVCSPEQYVELSEQIVPAVQIAGADFVESSNDQLDDSQSVENNVSQNVLNTNLES